MRAPKRELRIDGFILRRRTNQANFVGWKIIAPDGKEYFKNCLKPQEALDAVKEAIAKAEREEFKVGDRIVYQSGPYPAWRGVIEEIDKTDFLVRWDDDGKCSHVPLTESRGRHPRFAKAERGE